MNNLEQTLSIIKPDAVERNLDNEIKEIFRNKGFNIVKDKKIQIAKSEAEHFYKVHETKPFYNDLCAYLSSFENRPAYSEPNETIIAPVKVARSTINLGLNFFSVKVKASAKTNLPSASVFNTSIVLPL